MNLSTIRHIVSVASNARNMLRRGLALKSTKAYIEVQVTEIAAANEELDANETGKAFAPVMLLRTKKEFDEACEAIAAKFDEMAYSRVVEVRTAAVIARAAEEGIEIDAERVKEVVIALGGFMTFSMSRTMKAIREAVIEAAHDEALRIAAIMVSAECDAEVAIAAHDKAPEDLTMADIYARHEVANRKKGDAWNAAEYAYQNRVLGGGYEIDSERLAAVVEELSAQGESFKVERMDYLVILCAGLRENTVECERGLVIAHTNKKSETEIAFAALFARVEMLRPMPKRSYATEIPAAGSLDEAKANYRRAVTLHDYAATRLDNSVNVPATQPQLLKEYEEAWQDLDAARRVLYAIAERETSCEETVVKELFKAAIAGEYLSDDIQERLVTWCLNLQG